MNLDARLVDQAMSNVRLVNLDLDDATRRGALREAAARLRVLAATAAPDFAAENVLRLVMAHEFLWTDRVAYLNAAAAAIDAEARRPVVEEAAPTAASDPDDDEEVAAFLALTDGDRDATVLSDVTGLRVDLALRRGRVVRIAGTDELPYRSGVAGLRAILEDGAFSVGRRTG